MNAMNPTRRAQEKPVPIPVPIEYDVNNPEGNGIYNFEESNPYSTPIPVPIEYDVNNPDELTKRHAFWSLNEDILKIAVLTTNTPYPSRKIWCICACTHQRPRRKQDLIRRIQKKAIHRIQAIWE
ncbi:hypothetical protein Tco_0820349 [Tanacetum coccineum]|uniref:Uncharacterized protein n=1 Tax=Tanacetum coccineum TaxID=301880 RepID=A0ABQ5A950_9ASTR